jgi:hypothetical protein
MRVKLLSRMEGGKNTENIWVKNAEENVFARRRVHNEKLHKLNCLSVYMDRIFEFQKVNLNEKYNKYPIRRWKDNIKKSVKGVWWRMCIWTIWPRIEASCGLF